MIEVTLLDTSIATDNLGDEIIIDAVERVISEILPNAYVKRVATHDFLGRVSRKIVRNSRLSIVGGTNILSAHMGPFALWKMMPWDALALHHAVLLGVGWRDYMSGPDPYTKWVLSRVLSKEHIHSVRDQYTAQKLKGIARASDTACPTMWSLTPAHCQSIPRVKADKVVTTLTYYRGDPNRDRRFLEVLARNYREVYFWPQQSDDHAYVNSLSITNIKRISPSVRSYNAFLDNEEVDFAGTRLHGGIRAMQKGKRTLILGLDNRAKEISKGSGLPVLDRADIAGIEEWIGSKRATTVTLPVEGIAAWKAQFR